MKRLLLVDPDAPRASVYSEALASLGFRVEVAPGGFYALTLIERESPDGILVHSELGDMTGWELGSIVRRDPNMDGVELVLLAASEEEAERVDAAAPFDLTVLDSRPQEVASDLVRRLSERARAETREVPTSAIRLVPEKGVGPALLRGAYGELTFFGLVKHLCEAREIGLLTLDWSSYNGIVVFEYGKVRHSGFLKLVGNVSFFELDRKLRAAESGRYHFEPLSFDELALFPGSINKTAGQLLNQIPVDDHGTNEVTLTDELRRRAKL